MQEYINTLRSKNTEYKKRVLYISLVVVGLLLVAGWFSGLSTAVESNSKKASSEDTSDGPFSMMVDSLSRTFNKAKSGDWSNTDSTEEDTENAVEQSTIEKKEIPFGQQVEVSGESGLLSEGSN